MKLEDFRCPRCGHRGKFSVTAEGQFLLNEDGLSLSGDPCVILDGSCMCAECLHTDTTSGFTQRWVVCSDREAGPGEVLFGPDTGAKCDIAAVLITRYTKEGTTTVLWSKYEGDLS